MCLDNLNFLILTIICSLFALVAWILVFIAFFKKLPAFACVLMGIGGFAAIVIVFLTPLNALSFIGAIGGLSAIILSITGTGRTK